MELFAERPQRNDSLVMKVMLVTVESGRIKEKRMKMADEQGLQSAINTETVGEKKILNSWKEIAAYLNRGVRTVQRWERERGLPIRRPRGKPRSAVLAIVGDIEAWMETRPLRRRRNQPSARIEAAGV